MTLLAVAQFSHNLDGVETGVLSQSSRDDLHGVGEGLEAPVSTPSRL
jgi:hypothetical protein